MRRQYISASLVAALCVILSTKANLIYGQSWQESNWPVIHKIIKTDGWKIHGLENSVIVVPRKAQSRDISEQLQVYETMLKPEKETVFKIDSYILSEDGKTLYQSPKTFFVSRIAKYDIEGKVFCYSINVINVVTDKELKPLGYGGASFLFFFDDDGDGIFETYQRTGEPGTFAPRLPNWALANSKSGRTLSTPSVSLTRKPSPK